MKKAIKLLFSVACFSMLSLSACGGNTPPAHEHTWSDGWSSDATNHWHACTDEGYEDLKKDEANHSFVDVVTPPTYEAGGHTTHTCSVCNYSYVDSETEKLVHHYSSEWSKDETNHWHACTDEGYEDLKKDEAAHEYDDDHDATCECGYVRDIGGHAPKSTWSRDNTHHWHECTLEGCELKFDYNEHTADIHGFCDTCGEYLGQPKNMPYNANSDYENRADFGTLAAGTYYYRIQCSIVSGTLEVASTNMSSESYVFYWKDKTNEWKQSGDTCKVGAIYTSDSFGYLVITLTSQVTDVYITYYSHMSI